MTDVKQLPEAFLKEMEQLLGDEYEAYIKSYEEAWKPGLRVNTLKIMPEEFKNLSHLELTPVDWTEKGFYYEDTERPARHPFYYAGLYYLQEPSAMAPAELTGVKPGERVLDLCAAPGGKTTQLAAKLQGKGILFCNEIHPARARILSENVERMGIRNACVTNETPERLAENLPEFFDRILVDAPCSGEGMFRKNEIAGEEWNEENVRLCAERQDGILESAAAMLRPGGSLVYSTCTFAPAENEGSISRFLSRHPEFSLKKIDKTPFGEGCDGRADFVEAPAQQIADTLRLWPHRVKGEGHFAALLVKAGEAETEYKRMPVKGWAAAVPEKTLGAYGEFAAEALLDGRQLPGNYIRFGENLYLVPEEMPALKGLKVLRPGLHIGEEKKNRFEPSHALALTLSPREVKHVWNLTSEGKEADAYLRGQTFPAEGEKGWYLICVDGFSVGWGKLAGGIMKNHYPKGLRIQG